MALPMNKQDFDSTIRIPVVTDIVRPGDAEIIRRAKSNVPDEAQQHFEQKLKERIAELQSATGQDEYSGLGRAHAIRSEYQEEDTPQGTSTDKDFEQQIDKRRYELLRELSSMLK